MLPGIQYAEIDGKRVWQRPDANGWMPIETAPKDEQILVWDGCDEMFVGRWASGAQWISSSCVDGWTSMTPTHWMPLPEPPK